MTIRESLRAGLRIASGALLLSVCASAGAATATAVEYFYAGFGHYFVTAFADEIAALDAGPANGWRRTGETFRVDTDDAGGGEPVCRFFSATFAPKSSHFYTPYAGECEALIAGGAWEYEGTAFHLGLPDLAGQCDPGTVPLYRLYNDGMTGAPNHRYTTRSDMFLAMRLRGWVAEGNADTFAFACVPTPAYPTVTTAEGLWVGESAGARFIATVLETGSTWVLYAVGDSGLGFLAGPTAPEGNRLYGQLRNHLMTGPTVPTSLDATFVPQRSLGGTFVAEGGGADPFVGNYAPEYAERASALIAEGNWSLWVLRTGLTASEDFNASVSASGVLSGSSVGGCRIDGSVVPRGSGKNVYDVVAVFSGDCLLGAEATRGIALVQGAATDPTLTLIVMLQNADQTNGWIATGTR
jgi:hypothetical protein